MRAPPVALVPLIERTGISTASHQVRQEQRKLGERDQDED
jgi:hypothetical protein